jgi:hypothetical protein
MNARWIASLGALAVAASVVLPSLAAQDRARGRSPGTSAAKAWTPPRTADGRPDLQGVWISRSATPLERPKALEGRTLLSDAEVAELRRRAERLFNSSGKSDFAAGDNVFLAALADAAEYRNPNATHGSDEMVEREFDNHTSLVVAPADGRIPPLTSQGQQRQASLAAAVQRPAGPEDLSNALRCISWTVPRLGGRYGAGDLAYYRILQTPGHVVIYLETGNETRIVPIDGRPHLGSGIRQWNGDSRGRWEGNTLVVETTNFSSKSNFMGAADGLRLVERFTRTAPDAIKYEMAFADAGTWTMPWAAEIPLKKVDAELYEYACHEGNREMMIGMLKAARWEDRQRQPQ